MKKTVQYTPVGNNPNELTLIPPVVGEEAVFNDENGRRVLMSEHYAEKLVADNPMIFKIVPYVLPNPFTMEDLQNIEDLDKLEEVGIARFGYNVDKQYGVMRVRELLFEAQEEFLKAQGSQDEPGKKSKGKSKKE